MTDRLKNFVASAFLTVPVARLVSHIVNIELFSKESDENFRFQYVCLPSS